MFEFICKSKDVDLVAHEGTRGKEGSRGRPAMTTRDGRFVSSLYEVHSCSWHVSGRERKSGCRMSPLILLVNLGRTGVETSPFKLTPLILLFSRQRPPNAPILQPVDWSLDTSYS